MANTKLVVASWGVEIHTRKDEKDSYKQTGASVLSENGTGLPALRFYLGRELTSAELATMKSKGFLEV
jgi:hypothetical protein